jgi:hypothetical protein
MGWGSPPKPNKQLVAEQQSAAEQAKNDRIQQLQQELQGEDQTRSQFYGALPGGGGSGQSGQSGGGGGGNGGYGGGGGGFGYGGYGGLGHLQ